MWKISIIFVDEASMCMPTLLVPRGQSLGTRECYVQILFTVYPIPNSPFRARVAAVVFGLSVAVQSIRSIYTSTRPPVRMQQHLRIPLDPLIKLRIRVWRLIDPYLMAHYKTRIRPPRDDQIPQIPIILLDIALPRSQRQALLEQLPKTHGQHALPALLVWRSRIAGNVQSRHANAASGARDADAGLEHDVRHFPALFFLAHARGLVPHCVNTPVNHLPVIFSDDNIHCILL